MSEEDYGLCNIEVQTAFSVAPVAGDNGLGNHLLHKVQKDLTRHYKGNVLQ